MPPYAALGVIDQRGAGLEKFVVTGLDEATIEAIGPPPRGGGILGVLAEAPDLHPGELVRYALSAGLMDEAGGA